jgi:hypothetical protein
MEGKEMKVFLIILGFLGFGCGMAYSVCLGLELSDLETSTRLIVAQVTLGVAWAVIAGGVLWGLAYLVGRKRTISSTG